MLKASVSNEERIDVLLWYRLVGAYVGLLSGASASGSKWLRMVWGDSPHLAVGPSPCRTTLCRPRLSSRCWGTRLRVVSRGALAPAELQALGWLRGVASIYDWDGRDPGSQV